MSASQMAHDWATFGLLVNFKVLLVLVLACLAGRAMASRPAAERHLLWLLAIGGVLLVPLLERSPSPWSSGLPVQSLEGAPAGNWVGVTTASFERAAPMRGARPNVSGVAPSARSAAWPALRVTVPGLDPGELASTGRGAELFLAVWVAGSALLALRFALGLVHLAIVSRRARPLRDPMLLGRAARIAAELGISRPVRLLEGGIGAMPSSFGVVRPSLILPAEAKEWRDARQEHVLRHELAHLLRRDSLVELLVELACMLYWLNPLIWVAGRRIRAEREHACDDVVLLSGARPSAYADDLLEVARNARRRWVPRAAAIAMAGVSKLEIRVVAVLDERSRVDHVSGKPLATIGAGMSMAIVLLSTVVLISAPTRAVGSVPAVPSVVRPGPLRAPADEPESAIGPSTGSETRQDAGAIVQVAPRLALEPEPAVASDTALIGDSSSPEDRVQARRDRRSSPFNRSQAIDRCVSTFTNLWTTNRVAVEAAMRSRGSEPPDSGALVLVDYSIATPAQLQEIRSRRFAALDEILDHVTVLRAETAQRLTGGAFQGWVICYGMKPSSSPLAPKQ